MDRGERALVAWFGAKGVASVYFLALLLEQETITGAEADTVIWTTVAVVVVSILVHGGVARFATGVISMTTGGRSRLRPDISMADG